MRRHGMASGFRQPAVSANRRSARKQPFSDICFQTSRPFHRDRRPQADFPAEFYELGSCDSSSSPRAGSGGAPRRRPETKVPIEPAITSMPPVIMSQGASCSAEKLATAVANNRAIITSPVIGDVRLQAPLRPTAMFSRLGRLGDGPSLPNHMMTGGASRLPPRALPS